VETFRYQIYGYIKVTDLKSENFLLTLVSVYVLLRLFLERNAALSALDAAVLAAANNNLIPDSEKDEFAKTHFLANYSGNIDIELSSNVTSDRVRLVAEGELDLTFGNILGIDNFVFYLYLKMRMPPSHLIVSSLLQQTAVAFMRIQHPPLQYLRILEILCRKRRLSVRRAAFLVNLNLTPEENVVRLDLQKMV